jgi:hypothetical protein
MSKKLLALCAVLVVLIAIPVLASNISGNSVEGTPCACCGEACTCVDCQCDENGCACDTGGKCACSDQCSAACCADGSCCDTKE